MGCVFCDIIAKKVPAEVVFEDEVCVAFLDARPVFKGHTLVVPRVHWETLVDVEDDSIGPLFLRAKRIARAVERGLEADGTFVAMNNRVSQSVPHLHVHVVPRRKKDGLRGFFWPRIAYGEGEMAAAAGKIRAALA
jgi:histidine triad (HIT) family protein